MEKTQVLSYTVMFEKDPDGGYVAMVPTLSGCVTQGETIEEAKEHIKEAITLYLEVLKEDGDEIPVEADEHFVGTIAVPLPA